jgi:hypothetical protein
MEISPADSVSYRKNGAKNEETPEKCGNAKKVS